MQLGNRLQTVKIGPLKISHYTLCMYVSICHPHVHRACAICRHITTCYHVTWSCCVATKMCMLKIYHNYIRTWLHGGDCYYHSLRSEHNIACTYRLNHDVNNVAQGDYHWACYWAAYNLSHLFILGWSHDSEGYRSDGSDSHSWDSQINNIQFVHLELCYWHLQSQRWLIQKYDIVYV